MSYKQDCIIVNGEVTINIYGNEEQEEEKSVHKIRTSTAMNTAKKKVKSRDNICQCCGENNKQIQIHHIFPLSDFKELACEEGNLIGVCQSCHSQYHKMYEGEENPATFAKFIRDKAQGIIK